jgi:hypothetical protein
MNKKSAVSTRKMSNLLSATIPLLAFIIAVASGSVLILDYVHVLLGAVWIGIDVFLGLLFVSVTKSIDDVSRAHIGERMIPMTLFFIPATSIITPLLGYILAIREGIFSFTSDIFISIISLGLVIVVISFAFILPFSYDILRATTTESRDYARISRRIGQISKFALAQLAFQVGIVSLMAYLVVSP